jgi:hypothetical protein
MQVYYRALSASPTGNIIQLGLHTIAPAFRPEIKDEKGRNLAANNSSALQRGEKCLLLPALAKPGYSTWQQSLILALT